jgi:hypothetical protein
MGDDDGRRIRPGATVSIGQELGAEGSTGTSTGFHLHFQVEINGRPVNPVPFMADRGAPLNGTAVARNPQSPSPASLALQSDRPDGGGAFRLPAPGRPGQDSLHNPPLPIPDKIKKLYVAAAARYRIPWTLLAGIGMEENRPWPQQPHQLRRRPRIDAIHARDLGRNGCRRRRRRPRRHPQRR